MTTFASDPDSVLVALTLVAAGRDLFAEDCKYSLIGQDEQKRELVTKLIECGLVRVVGGKYSDGVWQPATLSLTELGGVLSLIVNQQVENTRRLNRLEGELDF